MEKALVNNVDIRLLTQADAAVLDNVATDVFDYAVKARWWSEFLADDRHHILVVLAGEQVVGMATGVHYVHPDKAPEFWINEVGVAPSHQGQGIGKALMAALLEHAKALGCKEAWVLTEEDNQAARRLYTGAGGHEEPDRPVYITFPLED